MSMFSDGLRWTLGVSCLTSKGGVDPQVEKQTPAENRCYFIVNSSVHFFFFYLGDGRLGKIILKCQCGLFFPLTIYLCVPTITSISSRVHF